MLVRFSYPEAMKDILIESGQYGWSYCEEVSSFKEGIERAHEIANSRNMPIRVSYGNQSITAYPKKISDLGY